MKEQYELLNSLKKPRNISVKEFFVAVISVILILLVSLPKIYISNQIYYTSRDIAKLKSEESILVEENRELKSKLEQIRYKNQIIDNLN